MSVELADLDYELPSERIAQSPARPRDSSRLLIVERHSTAKPSGQVVMVGGVVSANVIVCVQFDGFPQRSVAVQVRVMMLSTWLSVYVKSGSWPQLSSAEGIPVNSGSTESPHSMVILIGQVMSGAVVSKTVII